jgi:CheY-like chemotaxis protein
MVSKVILVAEDDPNDALIFKMMFRRATLPHNLHIVEDGQQAIDWLSGKGDYSDRAKYPVPDRVLLDLKMPVKTGFEALEWIRSQDSFQNLPVIILSSSDDEKDVKRAYQLGATTYFVKSPQLQDVIQYLRMS